jgi:L-lactate dehydrogenase complex protein LldG
MSSAREQILGGIRRALGRDELPAAEQNALTAGLAEPKRNLVPQRGQGAPEVILQRFIDMAAEASASLDRLDSLDRVPEAIAEFLKQENLPARAVRSPALQAFDIPWEKASAMSWRDGVPTIEDEVGVTDALAAVAETATLMLTSGPDSPTTLNFLPDTHVVVLRESQLVGGYEDAWDRLRASLGKQGMPRTVNLITGPSRTGDIEQTIQLGAHGPRRLHILLVAD